MLRAMLVRAGLTGSRAGPRSTAVAALVVTLAATLAGTAPGCAAAARRTASSLPEPIIQESLRTLAREDTRALFAEVLAAPEVRDATRGLVAHVTDGFLDALADPDRAAQLGLAIERLATHLFRVIAASIERELAPALERLTERLMATAAESLRDELGPALRETIEDPAMQETLGVTARRLSRDVARGSGDAWRTAARRDGESQGGIAYRVDRLFDKTSVLLQVVIAAVVILGALGAWRLARRSRRAHDREERARRREVVMLALLARAARGTGELPPQILRALERAVAEAEEDGAEEGPPPRAQPA